MRNRIDISDIRKRKSILAESSEMSNSITISNAYEQAKKTDRLEDIRKFMQECGRSRYNATEYIRPCIDYIEETKSPELISIFKSEILPRVNDYEIGYVTESMDHYNKEISEYIHEQIIKNKIADRILANHENICKKDNVDYMFESYNESQNLDNRIKFTCSVINEFNIPTYAKVNIAIEECAYLMQMYDIKYTDKELARSIIEYYSINKEFKDEELNQVNRVIKENYMIENITSEDNRSDIVDIEDKYISRSEHNPLELKLVNDKVFSASEIDWLRNIDRYFELLTLIVLFGQEESANIVIDDIIPNFYKRFNQTFGTSIRLKDIIKKINQIITQDIIVYRLDEYIQISRASNNLKSNIDNIERYRSALIELVEKLTDLLDMSYTKENMEYMLYKPIYESENTMTLYEYKDYKNAPLIYKMYKFDKFIQKQIRDWAKNKGQKLTDTMEELEKKVYEEISIYDMIVGENIDYVVESYEFDPERANYESIHNNATSIVKEFNESELRDTSFVVYYTMEGSRVNFHIKDNTILLLSEDEQMIADQSLGCLDVDTITEAVLISNYLDENFNLFNEATEYFISNPNSNLFESFCTACSLSGYTKETVQDIYDYIKYRSEPSFVSKNSYYMNSYVENANVDPMTATKSLLVLQAMFEAEDSKENPEDDNKTRVRTTAKVANSKTTPNTKISKTSNETKKSKVKEKKGFENPLKGISLNNIKLYLAGIRKNYKDLDSKTQTAIRNMDYTVEKLIKDIKASLVSDRRESIIKGSVIPSFHKCIVIAVGLAGLATFNAPLAVIVAIGGFAASKKLTEKERALLLDDIEIELELVDKEIQMADSRNQVKKMRELMKMKKTLQREYQRIKFNIRLGKDVIPSTTYVPNSSND